jgi:hypothetical protein
VIELSWRAYPAAVLAVGGLWLAISGARLSHDWARWHDPARNLRFVRGFRRVVLGLALIAVGVAWTWQIAWLLVLALVIGGEEVLESSVHAFAVRRGIETGAVPARMDTDATPGLAPRARGVH